MAVGIDKETSRLWAYTTQRDVSLLSTQTIVLSPCFSFAIQLLNGIEEPELLLS